MACVGRRPNHRRSALTPRSSRPTFAPQAGKSWGVFAEVGSESRLPVPSASLRALRLSLR